MNNGRNPYANVSTRFESNGYAVRLNSDGTNCNMDASDCYSARIVPTVESLSASGGWSSGG